MRLNWTPIFLGTAMLAGSAEAAQIAPDRFDPALVKRSLPSPPVSESLAAPPPPSAPARVGEVAMGGTVAIRSIQIEGADDIAASDFHSVTAPYVGRALSSAELSTLAGAVAGIARARGLVFASASVRPQPLAEGVLTVTLDEGRVDAVRSLGDSNAAADRILARLVTHRAVTRAELERALLLVGDLPGVTVTQTRYARENGFGILLVTIAVDRASFYAQADNRGTNEIGPWRATELASLRGAFTAGDEIGLLASQTPANPREFEFVSARYALPVGRSGDAVSVSGFYGATEAGGTLRYLGLTGRTYGGSLGHSAVLRRSRAASLWFDTDLRVIANEQSIRGVRFRDDLLTTLSGTLRTAVRAAGGSLHASVTATAGLPLPGMTHDHDPRASRSDGDARFLAASLQADWTRSLGGPFTLQLSAAGQVASRPLLATAEMSLGGPGFGRAYDYSERTGDQGAAGSLELQADLHQFGGGLLPRLVAYSFVDGGSVVNLRDGLGGGSLVSGGYGIRMGHGRLDGSVEAAFPLNADRLLTGNRSPRVSGRLSIFL